MIRSHWRLDRARVEWKLADCWIGVFVKRGHTDEVGATLFGTPVVWGVDTLDVWICLVPCVPLHLTWARRTFRAGEGLTR